MKYSKEFKLECVRKRKEGIYIETPPGCKKRHNFTKQVRIWSKIYDSLGEAGLEHGRPTLNTEQRLELIERVENGESYSSAALSAGIQDDVLIKWHKIYMEKGIDGLKSLKRGIIKLFSLELTFELFFFFEFTSDLGKSEFNSK